MNLEEQYPKLFKNFEDKDLELRHLLSVDENYEDFDSEEYEFDFEEYNYVIYIAELVQNVLGQAKMEELMVKIHDNKTVKNFLATELDIYGIKSDLSTEEVTAFVLEQIEEIV